MQPENEFQLGATRPNGSGPEKGTNHRHPTQLLVHWEIYVRTGQWLAAYAVAQSLVLTLPHEPIGWIYRSFALAKLGRVREARQVLLPGARKFPQDWRIAYNLACYNCQLGDVAGAWNWLDHAIALGDVDSIKSQALDDAGLKPLWARLGKV